MQLAAKILGSQLVGLSSEAVIEDAICRAVLVLDEEGMAADVPVFLQYLAVEVQKRILLENDDVARRELEVAAQVVHRLQG